MPAKKRDPQFDARRIDAPLPSASPLPLPAGQDAPVAVTPAPQPVMIQAQRDLARGLEETDCYTRLGKLIPRPRTK